jgi:hypothetical protein
MTNIVLFPASKARPMHVTPIVLYSIAEYDNAAPVEYDNFLTWNNIYLNDRQRKLSVLVPAHMFGSLRTVFGEVIEMMDEKSRRDTDFDPSRPIYNEMFNVLSRHKKLKSYSIANNSIGSFSRENSKVHLDFLTVLQIAEYGYLRIGFRRTVTRLPLSPNGAHAQQLMLYTNQPVGDMHV